MSELRRETRIQATWTTRDAVAALAVVGFAVVIGLVFEGAKALLEVFR